MSVPLTLSVISQQTTLWRPCHPACSTKTCWSRCGWMPATPRGCWWGCRRRTSRCGWWRTWTQRTWRRAAVTWCGRPAVTGCVDWSARSSCVWRRSSDYGTTTSVYTSCPGARRSSCSFLGSHRKESITPPSVTSCNNSMGDPGDADPTWPSCALDCRFLQSY